MTDFDDKIFNALSEEDDMLLKEMVPEPGYFEQVGGIFKGTIGWINWVLMIAQGIMFIVAVWMAWHFFEATDSVTQLRWGLPAVTLLIISATMKMTLMPVIQANRILREIRRIELLRSR